MRKLAQDACDVLESWYRNKIRKKRENFFLLLLLNAISHFQHFSHKKKNKETRKNFSCCRCAWMNEKLWWFDVEREGEFRECSTHCCNGTNEMKWNEEICGFLSFSTASDRAWKLRKWRERADNNKKIYNFIRNGNGKNESLNEWKWGNLWKKSLL